MGQQHRSWDVSDETVVLQYTPGKCALNTGLIIIIDYLCQWHADSMRVGIIENSAVYLDADADDLGPLFFFQARHSSASLSSSAYTAVQSLHRWGPNEFTAFSCKCGITGSKCVSAAHSVI